MNIYLPFCHYRATLRRNDGHQPNDNISLVCEGLDELSAALNAEHLAPGYTCVALSHYRVGFAAQHVEQAREIIGQIVACCAGATQIGHAGVGASNFRALSDADVSSETMLDEIHLINPNGEWEQPWRFLFQRTAVVVNAHFIGTRANPHLPTFRSYIWENKREFISFWSGWYITFSAEQLLSMELGHFERSGPLSCCASMMHLDADSTEPLLAKVDGLPSKVANSQLTAVWAYLAAPSNIPVAEINQIRDRLECRLQVEPDMLLLIQPNRASLHLSIGFWAPSLASSS